MPRRGEHHAVRAAQPAAGIEAGGPARAGGETALVNSTL
jgi:hypothetical protein